MARPCTPCAARQAALNDWHDGLGDGVAKVAEPVADFIGYHQEGPLMPAMLKPDLKSLIWLAIGAIVVPRILAKF